MSFADDVITHVDSLMMTGPHKRRAAQAAAQLETRGRTNLGDGWLTRAECLTRALDGESRCISRVILLSDGMANVGITSPEELAEHAAELRRLARIADLDLRKLFAADGTLRPIHDLPDEVAGAISSVDVVRRKGDAEEHRVRLPDRIRALDLLGRHLGLFRERVEVTGRDLEPLLPDFTDDELITLLKAKSNQRSRDEDERDGKSC